MNDRQEDLGTLGQEDSLQGKRKQATGWFQKMVGKVTGNRERQAKGAVQEVGGRVQSKVGAIEQQGDQAIRQDETQEQ